MLLKNLQENKEQHKEGTYVGMKLSDKTVKELKALMKKLKIKNPVRSEKLHTTIIYSRKPCPNLEAAGDLAEPMVGVPTEFEIFPTRTGYNALVIKFNCPDMVNRHKQLMKDHEATYDFPEYKCHITLSYNVDEDEINGIKGLDPLDFIQELEFNHEYKEALNLEWNASS
jgi:hypothetical protein